MLPFMTETDIRGRLDALIRERGEDYASLSKLLGRNPAYIQQFIKRGVPRRLSEEDRRTLARYFDIDERLLGAPVPATATIATLGAASDDRFVLVPRLDIGASAGHGALTDEERALGPLAFRAAWLRRVGSGNTAALSVIQVSGDSMTPLLADGDDILVDTADAADRLRDGIYVLRHDDVLMVKRIAVNPSDRRLTIRSDNPHYPSWPDCDPGSLTVIGRVLWSGRRIN